MKYILMTLCGTGILISGIFFGAQYEQDRQQRLSRKETINLIAVVSLDEGIYENDNLENYASQLIQFPDDNFVIKGLEDARQGMAAGRYAAYIVIPSEFSVNCVSINGTPTKTIIKYRINPNLREDVRQVVQTDITSFNSNLEQNMGYMYITAILEEFHHAQDAAQIAMLNDTLDMEKFDAINGIDLVEAIVWKRGKARNKF